MLRKHFLNVCMPLVVGRMAWESMNFAIFADLLYRSSRCRFKYGYLKFFAQLCTGQMQLLPLYMMPRDAPKLNPLQWYGVLLLLMSINTWNLEIDFWKKTTKSIARAEKSTESETKNAKEWHGTNVGGSIGVLWSR